MTLCGGVGGYDQLCCPASPKLLLGLDLGLGCDNRNIGTYGLENWKLLMGRGADKIGNTKTSKTRGRTMTKYPVR